MVINIVNRVKLFFYIYPTRLIFSKFSLVTIMLNVKFPASLDTCIYPCASTHCFTPGHLFNIPCLALKLVARLAVVPGFNKAPVAQ